MVGKATFWVVVGVSAIIGGGLLLTLPVEAVIQSTGAPLAASGIITAILEEET